MEERPNDWSERLVEGVSWLVLVQTLFLPVGFLVVLYFSLKG